MITGTVANRRATVPLLLRGSGADDLAVEALLDTGFSGYLAIPRAVVESLSLTYVRLLRAVLAHGRPRILRVHAARILSDGRERDVDVIALGNEVLVGMTLLEGSELRMRVIDGGAVTIDAF